MADLEEDSIFGSYDEADKFIREFEDKNGFRYIKKISQKSIIQDINTLIGKRIKFTERDGGRLYVNVGYEVRECMFGKSGRKKKVQPKKRIAAQNSRKMGCMAKIILSSIIEFPEYIIPEVNTKHSRSLIMQKLRQKFDVNTERVFKVIVKIVGTHLNHASGKSADLIQPVDRTVISTIKENVTAGVKNVDAMVSKVDQLNKSGRATNRRYNPSRKTIYNIMYNELNSVRHTKEDQSNTSVFLKEMEKDNACNYFFRPASDPDTTGETAESFLFVYQSKFQKQILQKYKSEIALLDATYNVCKFDLPLYMLSVQTNSGYIVVASFILGRDCREQVQEALTIISNWNQTWQPKFFLTDYDWREIGAIERVFKGSKVFLCLFHVLQAWKRWFSGNRDITKDEKENLLKMFICEEKADQHLSVKSVVS